MAKRRIDEFADLSPEQLAALEQRLAGEQTRRVAENKLAHYAPYQRQVDFHEAGSWARERLLMAATSSARHWRAARRSPITSPAVIPTTGRGGASVVRPWAGSAA